MIGFVKGFWENLSKFKSAKLIETGKSLFRGRNIAREFVQLGRCISLSKSSALSLSNWKPPCMDGSETVIVQW